MVDYQKNAVVVGCVTGIEKYGIFVSLNDYYSGLIHISEISDGYVRNINDYVSIGETIKVKILSIDEVNHHLKLTIKNVDYKINKNNGTKISETSNGFNTLSKNLDRWVKAKKDELLRTN